MGIHETIMKSAIADLTPLKKRGTGYGIFNTGYGLAMFIGSSLMGLLYDISIPLLITASVILEIAAIPLFFIMKKEAARL
jgi:MFS family permease